MRPDNRAQRAALEERPEVTPEARIIALALRERLGRGLVAVLFFGSRFLGTSPNSTSACDLFVIVEDYDEFYRARIPGISWGHSPATLARLNRVLPPNILSYSEDPRAGAGAKIFVISRNDAERALSRRAPDHFAKGRLTQSVCVLEARSEAERTWAVQLLEEARASALDWVPSFLPSGGRTSFAWEEFCLRMLEVSYGHEIRPEPASRIREVFEAQTKFFESAYGGMLQAAVQAGKLQSDGEKFRMKRPPAPAEIRRWRAFFHRSKRRATMRWLKYTMTYDDWLDYLVRKVERRTGLAVQLTPLERRLPFLLLWPKVFRVLRTRKTGTPSGAVSANSGERG